MAACSRNPYLNGEIYRTFRVGNLMDLVMLDTRLAGRDQQVAETSPLIASPDRSLLGQEQESWFFRELGVSQARSARWRVVGQQVMMAQIIADAATFTPVSADQWDGYQSSRNRFLQHLGTNSINNVVVLTGDIHTSWGNEIAVNPFVPSYVSQAVEFVTPAVTSPGIEDRSMALALQAQINASHPHIKYVELNRRGYMIVDLDRERVQSEWYHVATIAERRPVEEFARALACASGQNRLTAVPEPSRPATNPPPSAP